MDICSASASRRAVMGECGGECITGGVEVKWAWGECPRCKMARGWRWCSPELWVSGLSLLIPENMQKINNIIIIPKQVTSIYFLDLNFLFKIWSKHDWRAMMCKSSNSQVQVKSKSACLCIKSSQVQVCSLKKLTKSSQDFWPFWVVTSILCILQRVRIVLPQDLGLVSAQDELVKRHFHFLTRGTFFGLFKNCLLRVSHFTNNPIH